MPAGRTQTWGRGGGGEARRPRWQWAAPPLGWAQRPAGQHLPAPDAGPPTSSFLGDAGR